MKNKNMAQMKIKKFLLVSIILLTIIIIYFLKSKNYTVTYKVNNITIKETYFKTQKYYHITLAYNNKDYDLISYSKYTPKRKLIKDIKIAESGKETCLSPTSKHLNLYSICSNDADIYFETFNNTSTFTTRKTEQNINIANLNNNTFMLWNYNELIYLNNKVTKSIKLFSKDIYTLNLIYQTKDYLIIPDYNENYKFSKIYYINQKNGKVKTLNLRYELYFDGYFLGNIDNKVYYFDRKNEFEYVIDLKKKDIYRTDYKLYNNGHWAKTTKQKLKNTELHFENTENFKYFIKDDKLYGQINNSSIKALVGENVTKIIKQNNLDIYYLSKDIIYYYNPYEGHKPLLNYSEWEFNNTNMIFIF